MKSVKTKVIISGIGKSKEEALGKALSSLQSKINKEIDETIIRIEPLNIIPLEGIERISTERFMFFFLKREISKFYIKIEVEVQLTLVLLKEFHFKKERLKKSLLDKYTLHN